MALVLRDASQIVGVTSPGTLRKTGRDFADPGLLTDAAILVEGQTIQWIGPTKELPHCPPDTEIVSVPGCVILPGFVDSHTHLIHAGDRIGEWEQRLQGRSYQEIAAAGGGIMSSVRSVRSATQKQLRIHARQRLNRLLSFGVTTVEVKSGYGLSVKDELRCLEVIAELSQQGPQDLVPTFLGAHAVPEEYCSRREDYVRLLCDEMLPEVKRTGLAEFCDVFCETGVFSLEESEQILQRATALGLKVKLHADELTPLGGAELAARLGAVSADHLLCIRPEGIDALSRSGTVATLLPGTAFFLRAEYAPARRLIERGVTVALASDCNPGTCPTENLPLVGSMACCSMGMLPAEALNALTINAAAAVSRSDRVGSLCVGKQADLTIADVSDYRQLFYHFGVNHVWRVYQRGRLVHETGSSSHSAGVPSTR